MRKTLFLRILLPILILSGCAKLDLESDYAELVVMLDNGSKLESIHEHLHSVELHEPENFSEFLAEIDQGVTSTREIERSASIIYYDFLISMDLGGRLSSFLSDEELQTFRSFSWHRFFQKYENVDWAELHVPTFVRIRKRQQISLPKTESTTGRIY